MFLCSVKDQLLRSLVFFYLPLCMPDIDAHSRALKKDSGTGKEMRCYRTFLDISYLIYTSNDQIRNNIQHHNEPHDDLLTRVKERNLRWYGHETRSNGLAMTVLLETVEGGRNRDKGRNGDNMKEWTGIFFFRRHKYWRPRPR